LACFDLDDNLIVTNSGRKFPIDRGDWNWWDKEAVPAKLKELHENGTKIVIFSNQKGIEKDASKKDIICGKLLDMCCQLGFPIQVFLAKKDDVYRKPSPEMFNLMVKSYNDNIMPDADSFYCGDAAGRSSGPLKKFSKKKRFFLL